MAKDIVGQHPTEIIERDSEIIIRFYPKTENAAHPNKAILNLIFNTNDKEKRERIKAIVDELKQISL